MKEETKKVIASGLTVLGFEVAKLIGRTIITTAQQLEPKSEPESSAAPNDSKFGPGVGTVSGQTGTATYGARTPLNQ